MINDNAKLDATELIAILPNSDASPMALKDGVVSYEQIARFIESWGLQVPTTLPLKCDGSPVSEADLLVQRLCSPLVQPEDVTQLQRRTEEIFEVLKPSNGWEKWHVSRIAVTTLRIEHTERAERRVREKIRLRALLTWDRDRRLEAEMQGEMLARNRLRPSKSSEERLTAATG